MALIDTAILSRLDAVGDDLRNVMVFARRMRQGDYEISADLLKVIEDFLFVVSTEQLAVRAKVHDRLAQYRDLGEAAFDAVAGMENEPAPLVSKLIVFTGTYRPQAANDQLGGAA